MNNCEKLSDLVAGLAARCRAMEAKSNRWPGQDYPYDTDLPDDILCDSDFIDWCADRIMEDRDQFEWADKLEGVIGQRFNCSYDPASDEITLGDDCDELVQVLPEALRLLHSVYPG